ncbi:MAG: TlpA disulfide reductase family protein [Ignavibacteriales bacterium]|nr:TlpA disulfide reductase family protein [Ignavibacteriales bacterium]
MRLAEKFPVYKAVKFALLIELFFVNILYAQTIEVQILCSSGKAFISKLSGEKTTLRDSVTVIANGIYKFTLDKGNYHPGFYRLSFNKNKWIDFVNDGEDVSIKTYANNVLDSLKVINSESNKIYNSFILLNKQYKIKTELLQLILARYPKDDGYYKTTEQKVKELQNEYTEFVKVISQKNPNSFVARYIRSAQLPVVDYSLPIDKQIVYLKSHALDKVDFSDAGLIYSDVFSNKSIEYLTYYRNPQLPKELLEKEFMIAVDTILNKAKVHQLVYQHITEYLIDGFKKFGFDKIIDYIIQNYVIKDDLCLDEKTENSIQRRLDQNKKLPIGAIAPNIVLPDAGGKDIDLSKLNSEKVLIVFYASWCPHCNELIPKLNDLYIKQKTKSLEVFAISVDTTKSDWLNFIKKNNLNWINLFAVKGWGSKAASDYYLYATPTMFLLDKQRKIILKPTTFEEIHSYF